MSIDINVWKISYSRASESASLGRGSNRVFRTPARPSVATFETCITITTEPGAEADDISAEHALASGGFDLSKLMQEVIPGALAKAYKERLKPAEPAPAVVPESTGTRKIDVS